MSVQSYAYQGGGSSIGTGNPAAINCIKLGGVLEKQTVENGIRALPTDSIPHSKFLSLTSEVLFGPNFPEIMIVPTTKPTAKISCIKIGR